MPVHEDILCLEVHSASTRRLIYLIQVAAELLGDTATWDLCSHASDGSRSDDHFLDVVLRGWHGVSP